MATPFSWPPWLVTGLQGGQQGQDWVWQQDRAGMGTSAALQKLKGQSQVLAVKDTVGP